MRCDLADLLVPKQWTVPQKMNRYVPAFLYENLPGIGTAILLDLRKSELHEVEAKKKKGQSSAAPAKQETTSK
jgi:hypothetical protein